VNGFKVCAVQSCTVEIVAPPYRICSGCHKVALGSEQGWGNPPAAERPRPMNLVLPVPQQRARWPWPNRVSARTPTSSGDDLQACWRRRRLRTHIVSPWGVACRFCGA
jgi:hypothetical protein